MIANSLRIFCIYLLYRLALWAAFPLLPFYFLLRIRRDSRYGRGLGERLGALPFSVHPTAAGSIWLHAVSVGEVLSAIPLIQSLRERYPLAPLYVSTTTVAGRELAEHKLQSMVDGLFFAPFDYPRIVRRVLRALRPSLVVILETEIWPNLWRESRRAGASLVIVNGRMSDRAFPRYRANRWFFSAPLRMPHEIAVQTDRDRQRYIAAGAPPERVRVAGNLKYDFSPASGEIASAIRSLLDSLRPEAIWIAASTMPPAEPGDVDEDDVVIGAFRELAATRPGLLLVLVPRRPERFDSAASRLDAAGIAYLRRSQLDASSTLMLPGVLLLDTIGELSRLFAVADVVFMGGTLAQRGGHNILEPAFFGKPVIVGPHMENFPEISEEFSAAGAIIPIGGSADLAPATGSLLDNADERARLGEKARELAASKRGVAARTADRLLEHYDRGLAQRAGGPMLAPLAALWAGGSAYHRRSTAARKLAAPVLSAGNITMGGSGKTPFVEWLAARLHSQGLQPAILTRGYRRKSTATSIVIAAGQDAPVFLTGDEAQIFVRGGAAHVGVGADRFATGTRILREFGADVFLLDDGFQHWALSRNANIVLIDALDPFGGGEVFPRGRLREPLDALNRADVFVLTRTEPGLRTAAIESVLRHHNPRAPVFRARVLPRAWHEARTGARCEAGALPFSKVGAFSGIGNPYGFLRTLKQLNLDVRFEWQFGDHHSYKSVQLSRLVRRAVQAGAEALVTTEKDFYNFPEDLSRIPSDVPIYWLKIAMDIESGGELISLLNSKLV